MQRSPSIFPAPVIDEVLVETVYVGVRRVFQDGKISLSAIESQLSPSLHSLGPNHLARGPKRSKRYKYAIPSHAFRYVCRCCTLNYDLMKMSSPLLGLLLDILLPPWSFKTLETILAELFPLFCNGDRFPDSLPPLCHALTFCVGLHLR